MVPIQVDVDGAVPAIATGNTNLQVIGEASVDPADRYGCSELFERFPSAAGVPGIEQFGGSALGSGPPL